MVAGFRRQIGLQVLGVQGLSPDWWSGCLSWSREGGADNGKGILHGSNMKTFVTRPRRLIGWLVNGIECGYRLDGILER